MWIQKRGGGKPNGKLQLVDPTIWLNRVRVGGSVVIIDYVQLIFPDGATPFTTMVVPT